MKCIQFHPGFELVSPCPIPMTITITPRGTSYSINSNITQRGTQQNNKCRHCGDRDETINHMISECSKLAQKEYKTRHDWVGKVIHWEMCKTFKFDPTNKWYMHNPASVLENDTHKHLWDFDIHTDHLISARRPDLIIINNNPFPRLPHFTLDTYLIMLSVKQGGIKYHF